MPSRDDEILSMLGADPDELLGSFSGRTDGDDGDAGSGDRGGRSRASGLESETAAAVATAEVERRNRRRKKLRGVATVAGSALAALVVGILIGGVLLAPPPQAQSKVTKVVSKVSVLDQLESMRENTLSSLTKNYESLDAAKSSGAEVDPSTLAVASSVSEAANYVQPVIQSMVRSSIPLDRLQVYSTDADSMDEDGRAAAKVVMDEVSQKVDPAATLAGGSVSEDMGGRQAEAPTLPVLGLVGAVEDGQQTSGGLVYTCYVPVVSEDSSIANALFVIGVNPNGGTIYYIGYVGLLGYQSGSSVIGGGSPTDASDDNGPSADSYRPVQEYVDEAVSIASMSDEDRANAARQRQGDPTLQMPSDEPSGSLEGSTGAPVEPSGSAGGQGGATESPAVDSTAPEGIATSVESDLLPIGAYA